MFVRQTSVDFLLHYVLVHIHVGLNFLLTLSFKFTKVKLFFLFTEIE